MLDIDLYGVDARKDFVACSGNDFIWGDQWVRGRRFCRRLHVFGGLQCCLFAPSMLSFIISVCIKRLGVFGRGCVS